MGNDKTPAMILKIQAMRAAMSKSELLVCDYIIQHPDEVIYLSVSELAAKSGVSDATVVRTSQKIGSRSYQDLKISLAQDIVTPLQGINEEINVSDSPAAVTEKVFQGVIHTLNFTYRIQDPAQLDRAADILLRAGRICICGLGNSHAIAADIQHKLMRLGLNANAYSDNHLQVICSTFLKEGDALFAVSHSGGSRDVVHAAEIALSNRASVISLTNVGRSPLADISTVALHTASNETKYRRVALSSRIAQMALVDVLYTMIALKRPETTAGFYRIEKELSEAKY